MRKKTAERRQAILAAADVIFQEFGFERATMAQICRQAGFSKATLYSYFESKEDLFVEVLTLASEEEFQVVLRSVLSKTGSVREVLYRYAYQLLPFVYSPRIQSVRRLVLTQTELPSIAREFYKRGPARGQQATKQCLQYFIERGELKDGDADLMAMQLKALLDARWNEAFMFKVVERITPEQLESSVNEALDIFLLAYGTEA